MFTANLVPTLMACARWAFFFTQKRTSGGSSETDVNALAVIARRDPLVPVAMTVTPVANWPTVLRYERGSIMPAIDWQRYFPPFLRTTLTSFGLTRSGAVQPSRSYSAMHFSANPL